MPTDVEHADIEKILQEGAGNTSRRPDLRRIYQRGRARLLTRRLVASTACVGLIAIGATLVTGPSASKDRAAPPAGRSSFGIGDVSGQLLFMGVKHAEDPDNPPSMGFYSIDPAGGDLRRIAQDVPAEGWQGAAFSPDVKIAFPKSTARRTDYEIFTANVDGTGLRQLTDAPGEQHSPAWSPDGTRIAWVNEIGGSSEIWLMNADGTDALKLVDAELASDLSFSPDGRRIAYAQWSREPSEIFVVDIATKGITRLTKSPGSDSGPAWSPDGTRIAFERNIDDNAEGGDVYVMSSDGDHVSKLAESGGRPVWSPDGRYIAFTDRVDLPGESEDGELSSRGQIFIVAADGGKRHPVGGRFDYVVLLAWHPE